MVMGVGILLLTTLLGKIGTKRKFEFVTGVKAEDVKEVNARIAKVCEEWCTERDLVQKLQIPLDALIEGFCEENSDTRLHFKVWYDQLQIKLDVRTENMEISEEAYSEEKFTSLTVAIMMIQNMFDNVKITHADKSVLIHMDADI